MTASPPPFRFAIQGGPFGDPAALAEHARRVEALGYDELYSADHIGGVDPFAPLLAAALATDRLRVGPLVINNELHHPVLLARTAATIDRLTGGRLVLGMGTGYQQSEHDAIGSPIRPPGPRVDRFAESLAILRSLFDSGSAGHAGEHLDVHLDDLGVRPVQDRLPVLIGGHGRRVVGVAGRFADIYQFTGLTHAADGTVAPGGFGMDDLRRRAAWLSDAAAGRRIERSALVQFTAVADRAPSPDDLADRFGLAADTLAESPFVLTGPVEQIVDQLERTREELGISHIVVRDPDGFAPVVDRLRGR